MAIFVIASVSDAIQKAVKQDWIASSRSLSSGAHSRDPLVLATTEREGE
jgi:hypothetical protein